MNKQTRNISRRQAIRSLGGVSVLGLTACAQQKFMLPPPDLGAPTAPVQAARGQELAENFLTKTAYNLLAREPERATSLGVDTGEHSRLRAQLEDQSPAGQDAYAQTLLTDLVAVERLIVENDRNAAVAFDADTRTSLEVVRSAYSTALQGFKLPYGDVAVGSWRNAPYVVIQNVGSYIDFPRFFDSTQPTGNADDVAAYRQRLTSIPAALDGERERMQRARAMGVVPPDFLLDKTIAQMEQAIGDARTGDVYWGPFARKAKALDDTAFAAQIDAVRETQRTEIAHALQRQLDELKAQRAMASGEPGMWARPSGDEWYDWALRASTTTDLSPDEVHAQGLDELAALHAQMDPILRDIGYTRGTVGERMESLSRDPRYRFAEGDPGRTEIMALIEDRVAWIKGQMPRAFNTLVDPNMEIRRIPVAEESGAPGAYGGAGSKDGTIPGRMWINLRTTDLHRKYDLADLTYHETIPGHVWEGEYSNRLPLIRSILAFNAFSEGWALYGEQIADELGAYDDFKVGRLGYLQSLAFRACRMVVDTGLHRKRWSRAKAVDFFVTRNGSKRAEVESEVDRYCSWPGQSCGYKVGHSEIVRQRVKAQNTLGDAYDFKAFNDAVILGGNAPLDVMGGNVARYIASARSVSGAAS
ncbi:MAG: DUF885 domain-containing protein [Pontixanthobacter sp.]